MKRLSVIIVTYNSEHDIYDCLASIRKHQDLQPEELEIIIVDNNSRDTDGMFVKLRELYGNDIVLVKNTHNGGYGQGNNVGIRMATAPVILIMNPDVRLLMPIFKTATDAFLEDSRLAMYGMKQMLTEYIPSSNSFCCAYTVNGYLQTLLTSLCNRLGIYIPRYMHFSGSCFFIRKKMFEEVGLFDESVFMYGEEEDIHYRLWTSGYRKMVYNGTLKYIHLVKNRKPDIAYEQKIIDVAVFQNSKKGIPAINTLRNRLRNNSLLIAREKLRIALGKKDHSLIDMLKELRLSIKEKISNAANG